MHGSSAANLLIKAHNMIKAESINDQSVSCNQHNLALYSLHTNWTLAEVPIAQAEKEIETSSWQTAPLDGFDYYYYYCLLLLRHRLENCQKKKKSFSFLHWKSTATITTVGALCMLIDWG